MIKGFVGKGGFIRTKLNCIETRYYRRAIIENFRLAKYVKIR